MLAHHPTSIWRMTGDVCSCFKDHMSSHGWCNFAKIYGVSNLKIQSKLIANTRRRPRCTTYALYFFISSCQKHNELIALSLTTTTTWTQPVFFKSRCSSVTRAPSVSHLHVNWIKWLLDYACFCYFPSSPARRSPEPLWLVWTFWCWLIGRQINVEIVNTNFTRTSYYLQNNILVPQTRWNGGGGVNGAGFVASHFIPIIPGSW